MTSTTTTTVKFKYYHRIPRHGKNGNKRVTTNIGSSKLKKEAKESRKESSRIAIRRERKERRSGSTAQFHGELAHDSNHVTGSSCQVMGFWLCLASSRKLEKQKSCYVQEFPLPLTSFISGHCLTGVSQLLAPAGLPSLKE